MSQKSCVCNLAQAAVDSCKEICDELEHLSALSHYMEDCCNPTKAKLKFLKVYASPSVKTQIEKRRDDTVHEFKYVNNKDDCHILVATKKPQELPEGVAYKTVAEFLALMTIHPLYLNAIFSL